MFRRHGLLFVSLLVAGLPLAAQAADNVIFVLFDAKQHRAYIPEGTVLPQGLQLRAERIGAERAAPRGPRTMLRMITPTPKTRIAAPPLVFEYAPAARFEQARKQYEARNPSRPSRIKAHEDRACTDVYVTASNTGIYGTYSDGLTGRFCAPTTTVTGNSYLWEFFVIGDYSDDDFRINPYVSIGDIDGNFTCYDEYLYSGDTGSCGASAVTQKTGYFCQDTVTAFGQLYVIEYTNDPYHDNYLGFNLEIDFCTDFR